MKTYEIVYGHRKRKSLDTSTNTTSITADSIIEATKMAREEFNEETDYKVISVRLVKEY